MPARARLEKDYRGTQITQKIHCPEEVVVLEKKGRIAVALPHRQSSVYKLKAMGFRAVGSPEVEATAEEGSAAEVEAPAPTPGEVPEAPEVPEAEPATKKRTRKKLASQREG